MHTYACACVWGHVCEHTDLTLRLAGHRVGGGAGFLFPSTLGRKVDFAFSPIKVKLGLETIAGQFPGPSLGNSRPTGASLPFQHRLRVENWSGGGGGVAVEAAHWPGCQSSRVIRALLSKGLPLFLQSF